MFPDTIIDKVFETLVLMWNRPAGRVEHLFFKSSLLVLTKSFFGGGTGRWAIFLWSLDSLDTFLLFPNFL